MRVSRRERWANQGQGETIAAASSKTLARSLSTPMHRLGVQIQKMAKHLGILFGQGGRTEGGRQTAFRIGPERCTSRPPHAVGARCGCPYIQNCGNASSLVRIQHRTSPTRHIARFAARRRQGFRTIARQVDFCPPRCASVRHCIASSPGASCSLGASRVGSASTRGDIASLMDARQL